MAELIHALAGVFGLIVLGAVLRATAFVPASFWPAVERFTYFLALPALLVHTLAGAPVDAIEPVRTAAAIVGPVSALALALMLIALYRVTDPGAGALFTSGFQGAVRSNTYIGLALASALGGGQGAAVAAFGLAVLVPLVNVLSVISLSWFGAGGKASWRHAGGAIVRNPLVLACAAGMAVNSMPVGLPPALDRFLEALGGAALPLGLAAVGAGLRVSGLAGRLAPGVGYSMLKLLGLPLLSLAVVVAMDLSVLAGTVVVLLAALPTSPSSYVLARQMGGDHAFMAALVTLQTLLAGVTLPVVLWLCHWVLGGG
ncbi:AEC family transporter [Aquisalimonas lutea]|uniref:AEC family transporter n=1 Tax=Aquisalimonas lutea TaxID=1327750 RepID=UPI0025B5B8E1|nr:AEC family transporter [Aquisalimonas lutea]MDN3517801.1 AEC family transporter [Aquisalimonas lutea]